MKMNENTPAWALYGVLNNPTTTDSKRELATTYLRMKIDTCNDKLRAKVEALINEKP